MAMEEGGSLDICSLFGDSLEGNLFSLLLEPLVVVVVRCPLRLLLRRLPDDELSRPRVVGVVTALLAPLLPSPPTPVLTLALIVLLLLPLLLLLLLLLIL